MFRSETDDQDKRDHYWDVFEEILEELNEDP